MLVILEQYKLYRSIYQDFEKKMNNKLQYFLICDVGKKLKTIYTIYIHISYQQCWFEIEN